VFREREREQIPPRLTAMRLPMSCGTLVMPLSGRTITPSPSALGSA
jgi:hypothetical protein